jgi:hypothetical protein
MRKLWHNDSVNQEDNGKLKNSLAELECEEAIIQDKQEFGRVRHSMMNVLRAKYSNEIANRVLSRVNKRIESKHLNQKRSNFFTTNRSFEL